MEDWKSEHLISEIAYATVITLFNDCDLRESFGGYWDDDVNNAIDDKEEELIIVSCTATQIQIIVRGSSRTVTFKQLLENLIARR